MGENARIGSDGGELRHGRAASFPLRCATPMSEPPAAFEPRVTCERCQRPLVACYCAQLSSIETRTRVVVLQHPRERHKAIGTARIAALCLPSAEILVGVDFTQDRRARALLANPQAPAVLLYPSSDARDLSVDAPTGPVTLVVVDGTWHHAKTLVRENPWLASIPKVAFTPERPSEYRIRREPRDDYVSTIEALILALGLLEGDREKFQALMHPFRAMVDTQLSFVGKGTARKRRYRRQHADAAARLPPLLLKPQLLCVMGEANAWPHDRALGGSPFPHEIVHCAAVRLSDEARFEQVIKPRLPLSASPIKHAKLTELELATGVELSSAQRDWQGFLHADDVLCCWGTYALGLMRRDAFSLPGRVIDIRKVVGDYLKSRPGSAEDVIAKLDMQWQSYGRGRCGERLGMLVAITQWLAAAAHAGLATRNDDQRAEILDEPRV